MADVPVGESKGPIVGPNRVIDEVTVKGVLLGLVLAGLLAAANAYLGLKVGLTVAASIPAAAVSLGVLRLFRRSTILENNQVQTVASAGASVVSGIIFTVPALVMIGAWDGYRYWPMVGLAALGGVLGVMFSVPLRRALIVDMALAFPEGVATAEVLKTGPVDTATDSGKDSKLGRQGFRLLLEATGISALFKLCEGGFHVLTSNVEATRGFLGGRWLFRTDAELAPALLGVGYIVGFNIGALVFMGAVIGTILAVPIHWAMHPADLLTRVGLAPDTPLSTIDLEHWGELAGASFSDCRRIGVGAMIVGGLWSVLNLLKPLAAGVRVSLRAMKQAGGFASLPRTERDLPFPLILGVLGVAIIPLFICFHVILEGVEHRALIAGVMTVLMLVFGFLFTSVAGYMAGLVGSSNNPVSGVTMATVIASSLVLVQLIGADGIAGQVGPAAVLILAAIICTGACIAGDNLQDLKCGHVVGSTPWKQQLCLILGAMVSALVIPFVLQTLDEGGGIGRPLAGAAKAEFSAPQATLMKDVASGIFGGSLDWSFILVGCGVAVLLIILDKIQEARGSEFRFPVLAVAVGIYLPFGLSVLIFAGGLLNLFVARRSRHASAETRMDRENAGLILASGLVTGESLMGVLVALATTSAFAARIKDWRFEYAGPLTLALTALLCFYLVRRTLSASK